MPYSVDPPPKENEIECARCGAHVYFELSRCPECGVNLYEPEAETDDDLELDHEFQVGIISKIKTFLRRISRRPYSAEEVFGVSLDQSELYKDLLLKVGGDAGVVERLVAFESRVHPTGNRFIWLQNAIQRWERDNRTRTRGFSE